MRCLSFEQKLKFLKKILVISDQYGTYLAKPMVISPMVMHPTISIACPEYTVSR